MRMYFDIYAYSNSDANTNTILFVSYSQCLYDRYERRTRSRQQCIQLGYHYVLHWLCHVSPHSLFNLYLVNLVLIQLSSLQIPANVVITRVRPAIMLPLVVTLWGAVVCFMALVKNHSALFGLRIVLGFTEAVCITCKSAIYSPTTTHTIHL